MANSFSLMTTSIGQVLHVSNVIQVIVLYKKIVTILIGVLLVMISYFDPPWTFYSLVPSFWTFFWPYDDHLVVSNWNQKKTFYKKLKNKKVFGVKKILGDEKIREREIQSGFSIEIVLDFVFWDFNFRRFCVLFSVLQCIGLGSLKASGILQSVWVRCVTI